MSSVQNVSDGNVNMVYIVYGASEDQSMILKQSLPYVRVVPSMPLGVKRIYYEHEALLRFHELSPKSVPKVLGFDPTYACLFVEHLKLYRVLRGALINCQKDWDLRKVARVVAEVTFKTCDLCARYEDKQDLVQLFAGNSEMCRLTVEAIFTCPYSKDPVMANNWTSPQLDDLVHQLQADEELLKGVWTLRERFCTYSQALIHGDLHTGSLLVLLESAAHGHSLDTRLFDLEFAMYGPIGFDLGVMVANLIMSHLSGGGAEINFVADFWLAFKERFLDMWQGVCSESGEAQREFDMMNESYLTNIFCDTIGYAGCEMIRRCIGVAHVEDVLGIEPPDRRAEVEEKILTLGRDMIVRREALGQDVSTLMSFLKQDHDSSRRFSASPTKKQATLVIVSKFPRIGKCKTRLASDFKDEALALRFAKASLVDTIEKFSSVEVEGRTNAEIRRVILVAPGSDIPDFKSWLDLALGEEISHLWTFMEMTTKKDKHGPLVDLGHSLASAASAIGGIITFIGMDSPELTIIEYARSVNAMFASESDRKTAYISPAFDGGYTLLTLPSLSNPFLAFSGVAWSTSTACLSQALALTNAGLGVEIGSTFYDIDTLKELKELQTRLKEAGISNEETCPRVARYLSGLSI